MGRPVDQDIRKLDFFHEQTSVTEAVEPPREPTEETILNVQSDGFSGPPTPPDSYSNPTPADEIDCEPVMDILNDMVSGLIYIHGKNIVHRDLKPRNGIGLQLKPLLTPLQYSFPRKTNVGSLPTLARHLLPRPKSW